MEIGAVCAKSRVEMNGDSKDVVASERIIVSDDNILVGIGEE